MTLEEIKKILPTLPLSPGCYQYYNAEGEIIYVGKAKNLRRRVSSYFQKEHTDRKTRQLVAQIVDVKYIVVANESDALLLENNLIKTYQPKYNILLKDDKSYPSIVVTREPFPRIFVTRTIDPSWGDYYGPYTSVAMAHGMVGIIREMYKVRTCRHRFTQEAIERGKYARCLQYHIKRCEAPCEGLVSRKDYLNNIAAAVELLKGNLRQVIQQTSSRMLALSEELRYEEAGQEKARLAMLQAYSTKHIVAPETRHDIDVFSYEEEGAMAYVNMMQVHEGAIVRALTVEYKKAIDEEAEDIFVTAITELRGRYQSRAKEVILPYPLGWESLGHFSVTIPKQGEKKKLLELSIDNVKRYKLDQLKRAEKLNPEQRVQRLMNKMIQDLHLPVAPRYIECFDNSNLQGTAPVAACVVFRNGKPSKKEYRKFHVKTVEGADDLASMREIVERRYRRLQEEELPLPQLIVIDGARGQLEAAVETLSAIGVGAPTTTIIGLAERMEEVYFPGEEEPLFLSRDSETLRTLMQIRDEAHRFGITFHRSIRSKNQIHSVLDDIDGVGKQTKEALLRHFRSVKRIEAAELPELESLIGKKRGGIVYKALHPNEEKI